MGTVDAQKVYTEIRSLREEMRRELQSIKERLADADALSAEDLRIIEQGRREWAAGKTVSHDAVKRKLNL
jgi:hypothetical protein